jgi:hypothetical protein
VAKVNQLNVLSPKIAFQPIIMISHSELLKTRLITCHISVGSIRSATELINYPAGRDILAFMEVDGSLLALEVSFPDLIHHAASSEITSSQSDTTYAISSE